MGNTMAQVNKKIDKDKKRQVDKQYADQIVDQSQQEDEYESEQQYNDEENQKNRYNNRQQSNNISEMNKPQYDNISSKKYSTLLLTILSRVIRNQQHKQKLIQYKEKYNWIEVKQGLVDIEKQLQQSISTKTPINRSKLQRLKTILIATSNNSKQNNRSINPIVYTTLGNNHKPILAERIIIDQQQQLLQHQTQQQHYTNTQQQQQQQLTHYIRVNRLLYEWRRLVARASFRYSQNQLPLVHIYEYSHHQGSYPSQLTIHQQHIPYRLTELRTLTNLQGVYVLEQSLLGFMMLYQIVGQFHIQQDMIGFTYDGVVKVWLSPLFFTNIGQLVENFRSNNNEYRQNTQRQKDLIQNKLVTIIYMMVQKYSLFNIQFITLTRGFKNVTFKQALNLIHSYNKQEKVRFVTRLRLQGWYSSDDDNSSADYTFYRNNLFMKEVRSHNINNTNQLLIINVDESHSHLHPHSFVSTNNNLYTQKPSAPTMTSLSSHITILNNHNNNRCRPSIFPHGYSKSMSNNQNQSIQQLSQPPSYQPFSINDNNKNSITSRTYKQSKVQKNNNNNSEKQRLLRSNATFITIKSQQR